MHTISMKARQCLGSKAMHACRMEPPATPPLRSSTSEPGLLTSKERMTIIWGGEVKSRTGTGIFFTMYSHTASTLYLSCAEMGTTGAPSATVPWMKAWMASCWLMATLSLHAAARSDLGGEAWVLGMGMCGSCSPALSQRAACAGQQPGSCRMVSAVWVKVGLCGSRQLAAWQGMGILGR